MSGGDDDVLASDDVGTRVVRGGAQRAVAFAAGNLLVAVGSVLLLRHLGVADFGRYGTVLALVALVAGVTDAGLTLTATRELSVRAPGAERRALLGLLIGLRLALAVAGVLFALGFALLAGYDDTMVAGTGAAGFGTILIALQGALSLPLIVALRNGPVAIVELLKNAALVAGIVVLVALDAGVFWFLALQIAMGAVALASLPAFLGREAFVRPRWDRAEWRELALRALPVAVASVLGVVYFRALVLMSSLLSPELEHGYFVTSARIVELLVGLPLLLTGVALPVVSVAARDNPARLQYVLTRMTQVAALLGSFIAVLLIFGAEPIIVVLGGEEYRPAAPVLRIQGVSLLTIFLTQAWVVSLIGLERQRAMVWCTLVGIVAVIGCGLALIPALEADGAAIAAVAADAIVAGAMLIALRLAGPGRQIEFGFVPRLVVAAALALSPALVPAIPDVLAGALSAAVFIAAALALRLVPGEVLDVVRRRAA